MAQYKIDIFVLYLIVTLSQESSSLEFGYDLLAICKTKHICFLYSQVLLSYSHIEDLWYNQKMQMEHKVHTLNSQKTSHFIPLQVS